MKKVFYLLLFMSGAALGQTNRDLMKSFAKSGIVMPYAELTGVTSPTITSVGGVGVDKNESAIDSIKTTYIKKPIRVAISDAGLLRIVDAFKVITKQQTYLGIGPCPDSPKAMGMVGTSCLVAHFKEYTNDLEYHYEDAKGNVLTEVYLLTKL